MEYAFLGGPETGTTLRLDYRAFAYAGKFVVGKSGKAVLRTPDGSPAVPEWTPERSLPPTVDEHDFDADVLAAVSFSPDRTDPDCCRLRYVTVHAARRGEGLGPRLVDRTVSRLAANGFEQVRIAVNNPFAYAALYKCGFAYTGEQTGLTELVLERPADAPAFPDDPDARYRAGLRAFRDADHDLAAEERRFIAERLDDNGDADS